VGPRLDKIVLGLGGKRLEGEEEKGRGGKKGRSAWIEGRKSDLGRGNELRGRCERGEERHWKRAREEVERRVRFIVAGEG